MSTPVDPSVTRADLLWQRDRLAVIAPFSKRTALACDKAQCELRYQQSAELARELSQPALVALTVALGEEHLLQDADGQLVALFLGQIREAAPQLSLEICFTRAELSRGALVAIAACEPSFISHLITDPQGIAAAAQSGTPHPSLLLLKMAKELRPDLPVLARLALSPDCPDEALTASLLALRKVHLDGVVLGPRASELNAMKHAEEHAQIAGGFGLTVSVDDPRDPHVLAKLAEAFGLD